MTEQNTTGTTTSAVGEQSAVRYERDVDGIVVLTLDDLRQDRQFPDGAAPTGWSNDLHLPDPKYEKGFEGAAFIPAADGTLAAIGAALDAALENSDADLDWNLNDGILEIECEDRSKLIVNRHVPNREIWVAARSGGFHFGARDGRWRDTRTGATLDAALGELLLAQAGLAIELPLLPAPAGR